MLWRQHDIFMSAMGGRNILTHEAFNSPEEPVANARSFAVPLRFMILPPLMHGAAQWA